MYHSWGNLWQLMHGYNYSALLKLIGKTIVKTTKGNRTKPIAIKANKGTKVGNAPG
jgi:hypothetical protein